MRYPRRGGFRFRLARFFMGRNGPDTLYYFFLVLAFLSIFFSGFFGQNSRVSLALSLLYFVLFGYALFRLMSRNVPRRQRENAAFRRFFFRLTLPIRRLRARIKSRKTHLFRKCPACHATLRLARIPGEHVVKCPACAARFAVHVRGKRSRP